MCVHVGGKSTPKCNEKDNFHKALPNVKKTYVTLRKFTPVLKIFYTDISAISVTLCNSENSLAALFLSIRTISFLEKMLWQLISKHSQQFVARVRFFYSLHSHQYISYSLHSHVNIF